MNPSTRSRDTARVAQASRQENRWGVVSVSEASITAMRAVMDAEWVNGAVDE